MLPNKTWPNKIFSQYLFIQKDQQINMMNNISVLFYNKIRYI